MSGICGSTKHQWLKAHTREVLVHLYVPDAARGVRFDDPAFGIDWPVAPAVMSERDRSYPAFEA